MILLVGTPYDVGDRRDRLRGSVVMMKKMDLDDDHVTIRSCMMS